MRKPAGYGRLVARAAKSVTCTLENKGRWVSARHRGRASDLVTSGDAAHAHGVPVWHVKAACSLRRFSPDDFTALEAGTLAWESVVRLVEGYRSERRGAPTPSPVPASPPVPPPASSAFALPVDRKADSLAGTGFESLIFQVNKISVIADVLTPADLVATNRQRLRSQFVRSLPQVLTFLTELQRLLEHAPD